MSDEETEKDESQGVDNLTTLENPEDELDLDEDLAEALGDDTSEDGVDVDALLQVEAPDLDKELGDINAEDFSGVIIEKDTVSDEVDEESKVPSAFKAFIQNMPSDQKLRLQIASAVMLVAIPLAALIYMGKILPRFELPYFVRMNEISNKVYNYPTDSVMVPLFDEFRSNAFTVALPETVINLKSDGGIPTYGQFEFFVNLRDEELKTVVKKKQSEILDIVQRVLEQITWAELQTPMGKEKVKKAVRHRMNEYLNGNLVIGVYYRSVILKK